MICVGLIGNGKISDTHKEAYARMDGVSLEVYCDANPANLVGIEGARSSRERDRQLAEETVYLEDMLEKLDAALSANID